MRGPITAPLCAADIDAIARIHAVCFDDPWNVPTVQRILAMGGAFGLTTRLVEDDAIAGFALARTSADECELLSLGVAPHHRRRGLGAVLLDATMARATLDDVRTLFLEVAETNDPALKLYLGRGFVPVGRRLNYYELKHGGYETALTMRCELPAVWRHCTGQPGVAVER